MTLEELYELQKVYEDRIANYFAGETENTGDRGYQDLLGKLEDVVNDIERLGKKDAQQAIPDSRLYFFGNR